MCVCVCQRRAVYGGASPQHQVLELRSQRPQIVVGTPGRLLDLVERRSLDLKNVSDTHTRATQTHVHTRVMIRCVHVAV